MEMKTRVAIVGCGGIAALRHSESMSKKSLNVCIQSAGQAFVGGHADQADVIDFLNFTKEGMNSLGRSVCKVTD